MEINIKQNISADDLLQNTSWFGETDHDIQSIENLKKLNIFVTDLIQKIYWKHLEAKRIAENQGSYSAKEISNETQSILINAVKIATDEGKWDSVDKLFSEDKEEKFFLYNPETTEYLVELIFGDITWLKEGELDSVPRTWVFSEKEIIEKFGSENLKYKLSVSDWEKIKQSQ